MARTDRQINFRIPAELKDQLDLSAALLGRSLTADIVARLQQTFEPGASALDLKLKDSLVTAYMAELAYRLSRAQFLGELMSGIPAECVDEIYRALFGTLVKIAVSLGEPPVSLEHHPAMTPELHAAAELIKRAEEQRRAAIDAAANAHDRDTSTSKIELVDTKIIRREPESSSPAAPQTRRLLGPKKGKAKP